MSPRPETVAGIYYQPKPAQAEELERVVTGDPGGTQAFTHTLAALVRGEREVWAPYLEAASRHDGKLRCVFDVHVLANDRWLGTGKIRELLDRVLASEHGDLVGGWYVCDEPFARSHKNRKNAIDLAPIMRLVTELRTLERETGRRVPVIADYGTVYPLLKRGGDPVNGNYDDFTDDRAQREEFLWNGEWCTAVTDARYNGGKPLVRDFGFFGEEITMINWFHDVTHLRRWGDRIFRSVPPERVQLVLGYDVTEKTPAQNAAWVQRTRAVIEEAKRRGVRGFWLWAWQEIRAGGRRYKGVGDWWESVPDDAFPSRYAALVESIHQPRDGR